MIKFSDRGLVENGKLTPLFNQLYVVLVSLIGTWILHMAIICFSLIMAIIGKVKRN